ncbi:MAG: sigma-70 family RNA polymerase sigma factor [Planctomycetota bacterium]
MDSQSNIDERLARFTELLSTCQAHLLATVYAMVQNMADAEDIFQRASLILWRKFDEYEEGTEFRKWAVTVTRYEALNFIRKRRSERLFFSEAVLQALADTQQTLAASADEDEQRWAKLSDCLGRLPEHSRRLLKLYYEGTKTLAQVATQLGSTEGATRTALCRVRQALRRCVQSLEKREYTQ